MNNATYIRLSAAALLLSATFFSCDKDNQLSDNPTTGEEVFIQIRTLEIAEGNEADITRSASLQDSEPEYIPTGDGLLVNMSIEEDASSPLRAEKSLIANAWFRVIAIDHNSQRYISHGDFQQGGVTSLASFHVPSNANYDIICFSYNSTTNTLPAFTPSRYDDISGIDLSGDLENLLWQKKLDVPINAASLPIPFVLDYKAARVRVVVDCTYNNWTITNIANTMKLNSLALAQSVNLMTGDPSGGSAAEQTVTWPTLSASIKQTSNPFIVMPTSNSVNLTVSIPVNSVSRQTYQPIPTEAGYTGKFTAQLQVGHSYNLLVKLKAPKWAGSNIYYNGSSLIFYAHENNTYQGYQGVFFKFGSLLGISGAGSFVANSTLVYKPTGGSTTYGSWAAIEHTSSGNIGADNPTAGTGDICRYLSNETYRLPTASEFGTGTSGAWNVSSPVAGGWIKGSGTFEANNGAGYANGAANLLTTANGASKPLGSGYNQTMNVTLPASGFLYHSDGGLYGMGAEGGYWTGSVIGSNVRALYYGSTNVSTGYSSSDRSWGFTVRCVKND